MQTYLTKNGILAANNTQVGFFTNTGDFVRQSSFTEYDYLVFEVGLMEVEIPQPVGELEMFLVFSNKLPKFKFLFSSEDRDDTHYKWETCNNGGDYANYDRHSYFVRMNGDKVEFACLTESYSSAEFPQTWNGSYQNANSCNYTTLIDVEGDWKLSEQQTEPSEASLLQGFGQLCKLDDLFQPSNYIPSRDSEETEPIETPITFAEYLRRWRLISNLTGKSPYEVKGLKRGAGRSGNRISRRFVSGHGR